MNRSGMVNLSRGYASALFAAAVLSTTAILIRYLTVTYAIPPLVLAFWRDALVTLTLAPALALLARRLLSVSHAHIGYLAIFGLVLAAFNATWTYSVAMNGAAVATVLVYGSAAFTALLGWGLLKERLGWAKLLAIVLCLTGCVLVSGALSAAAWGTNLMGLLVGVLSGLCYAVYSLMGRSAAQRELNPWTTLASTFGFAAICLLVLNLLPQAVTGIASQPADLFWLGNAYYGWGILLVLAAGPTVAGFGLYNISLGFLPASVANLIVTLEPAFTALSAYLLLGEQLSVLQFGGGLLILCGVVFLRLYEGRSIRLLQTQAR